MAIGAFHVTPSISLAPHQNSCRQAIAQYWATSNRVVLVCSTHDLGAGSSRGAKGCHWVLKPQNAMVWQCEFYKWLKETL